jgi:hypothetical protein
MRYEGALINDLLYPIYGARPGRLARIVTGEGESEVVAIDVIRQAGDQAQGPEAQGAQVATQGQQAAGPRRYKLTKDANYNVTVKVTRAFDRRRDQEATQLGDLIEKNPALITWFGDLFFKSMDGPGHKEMAERARVMLAPAIQQMLAQKSEGKTPLPPEVQAALSSLQDRLQKAGVLIEQLADVAKGKKLEADTKLKIEQSKAFRDVKLAEIDRNTDLEKTRADNATRLAIAHIAANAKGAAIDAHAAEEALALGHASLESARGRLHELESAEAARDHEAAMASQAAGHQAEAQATDVLESQRAQEADHSAAADLAAQQAAAQAEAQAAGAQSSEGA